MKPIRIYIEKTRESSLNIDEIKYTFRSLLNIAGFPCHFVKEQKHEGADIYYGKTPPFSCSLFIEMADIRKEDIRTPLKTVTENNYFFLLFENEQRKKDIISKRDGTIDIWNDIILTAFYLLSGWQEKFIRRDNKDRHLIKDSFLYKEKLLQYPLVNQYSIILRDVFTTSHIPISLWPSNKKYAVALSHDVDYPELLRWIEVVRYLAKYKWRSKMPKILDIIAGKESFWKFKDWLGLEQRYGLKSAFYFCGFKGGLLRYLLKAPDPFYDVSGDNFKRIMNYIAQNGFEVGMHSSYLAYQSINRFRDEKMAVEKTLGQTIFGNRHHYWHMNPNNPSETALIHERLGLLYDSSISFECRTGFRYGICSPFHLYDPISKKPVTTLQLPPTLMDNHLFGHARYSYFRLYQSEIDTLLGSAKRYGGVFVADYHVRVLNDTFYPKWGESYEYLLKKITEVNDFYCDIPANIAKYWMERERKINELSKDEDSSIN